MVAADLEDSLVRCGYRVCGLAASGEEALALARHHRPDLALMDIRLQGDMDGIATAELLRQQLGVPVIFLSAHTDEATMQRAKRAAPIGFLVKPFDARGLQISVEMALEQHRGACQLLAANQEMHELNITLEQKMAERTSKLASALHRLRRVEHDAYHDSLTGLANRGLFLEQLDRQLAICARNDDVLALLYLDLDGFKEVNDTLGHGAGDALLRAVAVRIEGAIRRADVAARLGGDEFAVLLLQSGAADGMAVADKLVTTLSQPYRAGRHDVTVSVSIGVAAYPETGDCGDRLLERADAALYAAKRAGKGRAVAATPVHADGSAA